MNDCIFMGKWREIDSGKGTGVGAFVVVCCNVWVRCMHAHIRDEIRDTTYYILHTTNYILYTKIPYTPLMRSSQPLIKVICYTNANTKKN